jgi:putative peptide zinc metalloprotease protein
MAGGLTGMNTQSIDPPRRSAPLEDGANTELLALVAEQMRRQQVLPRLREDLGLHAGPTLKNGSPTWVVEDPVRGRFFRIGWLEFELLSRWACGDAKLLVQQVTQQTLLKPEMQEVLAVKQFLLQHELVENTEKLAALRRGETHKTSVATQALHNYLMFRLPLVNPDRWLERMLPWARPLLGMRALWLSVVAGVLGLFFAFQQWDTFASTFVETLSLQGLLSYSLALVFAKVIHEMGHAFTAKQLGLRVPRMGVALVLLLPMLYTDTGETWRLPRRRERFTIAVAGMRIELMLAAWCTLAWSFLPDGALRSACFFLATTSWLITLAINASPFLRFDGYYMMSDATGIPNLHDEAAHLVKHFLRKWLLGFDDPAPQLAGEAAPRWLLGFGLITAVYRFFLFLGIAITVYHYFFKLLGLFLFAVEIWWFILKPIWNEVKVWIRERARIQCRPAVRAVLLLALLMGVLLVPWNGRIFASGWIRAGQETTFYAPRSARLVQAPQPGTVTPQQSLALLESAELDLREARASARMQALDNRLLSSIAAQDLPDSAGSNRAQLVQQQVEVRGAHNEAHQLLMTAPFAGLLVDVALDATPGSMVSRHEPLARLINTQNWVAEVFLDEDDAKRLQPSAQVLAYLLGGSMQKLAGTVASVDTVPVEQLPTEMLAARYGGPLLTTDDPNELKPRRPLYRVRVALSEAPRMQQARLATFVIQAERVSLADALWRGALGALLLQGSF